MSIGSKTDEQMAYEAKVKAANVEWEKQEALRLKGESKPQENNG